MQMVEVKLLGELGKRFGRKHRFMAHSARDIFSALSNQLEGFKDYFCNAHEKGIGFKLIDGDPDGMDYENVLMGCRRLIIAPIVSGGGAIGRILIGVALIALLFGVGSIAAGAAFAGSHRWRCRTFNHSFCGNAVAYLGRTTRNWRGAIADAHAQCSKRN
jgi:predicted phage tail protein